MYRQIVLAGVSALLLTSPRPATAQAATFEKTLTVAADAALEVASDSGAIVVRAGQGQTVVVRGRVDVRRGWNVPANAADLARRVADAPPVALEGNTVRVGRIDDETTRKAVSVSYDITVPTRTSVNARSGSGRISIENTQADVSARTGSGEVVVKGVGADADLRTGSGRISVDNVAGAARVSTGSGAISALNIGRGLEAETGSGAIEATLTGKGDVQASTGSGAIRLKGVVGALSASSGSGTIVVSGSPAGDWKVNASSGSVAVSVPSDAGFVLDARSGSGSLDVDVPLTSQQTRGDKHRIQGTVRGGGPSMQLSTSSGSISVK